MEPMVPENIEEAKELTAADIMPAARMKTKFGAYWQSMPAS